MVMSFCFNADVYFYFKVMSMKLDEEVKECSEKSYSLTPFAIKGFENPVTLFLIDLRRPSSTYNLTNPTTMTKVTTRVLAVVRVLESF